MSGLFASALFSNALFANGLFLRGLLRLVAARLLRPIVAAAVPMQRAAAVVVARARGERVNAAVAAVCRVARGEEATT